MRSKFVSGCVVLSCGLVAWGCGDDPATGEASGTLRAAVELSEVSHDVTAVRIDVVGAGEACDASPLASETVSLEGEALPNSLTGSGTHAFGDGFFVLPVGAYRACATPLVFDAPSTECGVAESDVDVSAGSSAEVVLISQCLGEGNGGADVVVSLNDSPVITEVALDPSKFISVCESLQMNATATDANGDDLTYTWSVTSGTDAGRLRADGASAVFSGAPGEYELTLGVDDGHGGSASLSFSVHVSDAVCSVPAAVQDIFSARCAPCHTSGSSGGLKLDPASASFANLVGVNASSTSCADRVRVVPGDSASSYLIAKLRGASDICGVPMPRNLPALPEEEIQAIEAWIDALPH
jgi:hypothetical protein